MVSDYVGNNNQFIYMREHEAQDKDNEKTIEYGGNGGGGSLSVFYIIVKIYFLFFIRTSEKNLSLGNRQR